MPKPLDYISQALIGELSLVIPFRDHDFVVRLQLNACGELRSATTELDELPEVVLALTYADQLARRQYQWQLLRSWLEVVVAAHYWVDPADARHPISKAIATKLAELRQHPDFHRKLFKQLPLDSWAAKFYRLHILRNGETRLRHALAQLADISGMGAAQSVQEFTNMNWEATIELAHVLLPIYRQQNHREAQALCFLPFLYFHTPRAYDLLLHYRRLRIYGEFERTILTALSNHQSDYLRDLFLAQAERTVARRLTDTTLIYGLRYYREQRVKDLMIELLIYSHNDQRSFASTPRLVFQYLQEWGLSRSDIVHEVWAITVSRPNPSKVIAALAWLSASRYIDSIDKGECLELFSWYLRHSPYTKAEATERAFLYRLLLRHIPYFTFADLDALAREEDYRVRCGLLGLMRHSIRLTKSPVNKTAAIRLIINHLQDPHQLVRHSALRKLMEIAPFYNINAAQDALLDLLREVQSQAERELILQLLRHSR
ncbi:MAG: hypothetical protein D6772_10290 [Bacteroidetes bacterium]|nr:MAG: hypothetical protein D6772_10290 [Bacteroidota bacterium]